jgi:outer membrane protein
MKSTNWVINGILALAVIILYVLHFSGGATPSKQASMQAAGGTKVAYFEIDSIQNNYIFFKDVKDALQLKDMDLKMRFLLSTKIFKRMVNIYLKEKL